MGNGVPNQESNVVFEPLSGDLVIERTFRQHFTLTRTQHNTVRAAALNAGGMSNISAAYTAIRGAYDGIESGRDAWVDRMTTGVNQTQTDLLRRGEVWYWSTTVEWPSPPQP
jgi:hypothetical protein